MRRFYYSYLVPSVLIAATTLNAYAASENPANSNKQLIASDRSAAPSNVTRGATIVYVEGDPRSV